MANVDLGERGAQATVTVTDYIGAIDALVLRRETLERTIGEAIPGSPLAGTVARLRCLRGLDTLSAVGLAAEIADFTRFERPAQANPRSRSRPPGKPNSACTRSGGVSTPSAESDRPLNRAQQHRRPTVTATRTHPPYQ